MTRADQEEPIAEIAEEQRRAEETLPDSARASRPAEPNEGDTAMTATRLANVRSVRVLLATAVTCAAVAVWLRMGPLPAGLLDEPASPSTIVIDRHGVALQEAL